MAFQVTEPETKPWEFHGMMQASDISPIPSKEKGGEKKTKAGPLEDSVCILLSFVSPKMVPFTAHWRGEKI